MSPHSGDLNARRCYTTATTVPSPYLTPREAIVYLRLHSLSALYRLIREHRLPTCRRGRLDVFDARELRRVGARLQFSA